MVREGRAPRKDAVVQDLGLELAATEVDAAWRRLLEDTLPPEKREVLNESYQEETDPRQRYHMLLEFSSYLRQGSEQLAGGGAGSRGAGGGSGGGGGGYAGGGDDDHLRHPDYMPPTGGATIRRRYDEREPSLCWEFARVLACVVAIVGAILGGVYYVGQQLEAAQPDRLPAQGPLSDVEEVVAAVEERAAEEA